MIGKGTPPVKRVTVQCPHCDFEQLESPIAKSTFCRRCGEHYELGKPQAAAEPEEKSESFFSRISGLFSNQKDRNVTCFNCRSSHIVAPSAKSTLCPHCSSYITLDDYKIKTVVSRRIETQGCVHIYPKGELTNPKVTCGEAFIEGTLRGSLLCSGEARIKLKGKFFGDLDVNKLIIERRCDVEVVRPIKARSVEISGKMTGTLTVDGTVTVTKRGWLEGDLVARALNVEKGGHYKGRFRMLAAGAPLPKEEEEELHAQAPALTPLPDPVEESELADTSSSIPSSPVPEPTPREKFSTGRKFGSLPSRVPGSGGNGNGPKPNQPPRTGRSRFGLG